MARSTTGKSFCRDYKGHRDKNKMEDLKIILFLCNWGPHGAYQALQDRGYQIPPEIKMVRIPCTGRITKALLFKAFEMGADGVTLVGCKPGTCRYGSGTDNAMTNTEDTRDIIGLLGLTNSRMRFATFLPDESEALRVFLEDFSEDIRRLGPSPITPALTAESQSVSENALREIVAAHDVYACQDCGKCTSSCPLALVGKPYSPRTLAGSIIADDMDSPSVRKDIYACLTCGICYDRCPSQVNFPQFIRDVRLIMDQQEKGIHQAHGGFFQSLMRAMTSGELKPDKWSWLPEDIEIDSKSKTVFFGGCAPYFDVFFRKHHQSKTTNILTDSLRLLNFFDISPALLKDERCCGHDLLWSGDRENFLKLARLTVASLQDLGVEEVITACPECYRTMAYDYPAHGINPKFKLTHIYEFLENKIDNSAVAFRRIGEPVTYQDSCRLNQVDSIENLPRKLISRIAPETFKETKGSENAPLCCGNCAWTGCDAYSKALQVKHLQQAHATGSNLMITSCPKCQIHLRCAMEDPFRSEELRMEMKDLTSVIAQYIYWE